MITIIDGACRTEPLYERDPHPKFRTAPHFDVRHISGCQIDVTDHPQPGSGDAHTPK